MIRRKISKLIELSNKSGLNDKRNKAALIKNILLCHEDMMSDTVSESSEDTTQFDDYRKCLAEHLATTCQYDELMDVQDEHRGNHGDSEDTCSDEMNDTDVEMDDDTIQKSQAFGPSHNSTVIDPSHSSAVIDPSHSSAVIDPSHSSTVIGQSMQEQSRKKVTFKITGGVSRQADSRADLKADLKLEEVSETANMRKIGSFMDNVIMTGGKYDHSIRRVVHGLREKPSKVEKFQSPETKKKKKGKGKHEEKQKHGLHRKECIAAVKIESNGQKNSVAATEESQNHSMNEMRFCIGTLVWGKIKGFPWWPAVVISHIEVEKPPPQLIDQRWVRWYGDLKHSLVSLDKLQPFHEFKPYYNDVIFKQQQSYRKGVYQALTMAAKRAERPVVTPDIAPTSDVTPLKTPRGMPIEMVTLCLDLVNWAMEGFLPNGPGAIVPSKEEQQPRRPRLIRHSDDDVEKPSTNIRAEKMRKVVHGKKTLRDYCIACGDDDVITEHPLFEGEVCDECRQSILETAFLYDDDGYQSFCCICGEGRELVLCSNDGCFHCYCLDCLDCLVGRGATRKAKDEDTWMCCMCAPDVDNGLLKCRKDWSQRLHQFFSSDDNNSEQFESFPVYCPLPIEERKPMRVLSLFDGIATGRQVLKDLGILVEKYFASEICCEAINVARVNHPSIIQIGDVKSITDKVLKEIGPIDLLIGGSPCNDLSIVNPIRKGLYNMSGTGCLFFDFYRVMRDLQVENANRPLFWMFENVASMRYEDKIDISRFLKCNPVLVDAKDVSAAHRARYFWGNLPGMNRPSLATESNNSLNLQSCLEPHCNRQALFNKVRTVTSKANSIKQCKEQILPVKMGTKSDALWCTEMERLFGFPEHYTDVGNMSRTARQKLLGQAWSVPVARHLLAPLKEYFACDMYKYANYCT